jgi:hypothetical protein
VVARPATARGRLTGARATPDRKAQSNVLIPDSLRALIRAKLSDGRLPHESIRISGGPGNGETCVACDEVIAKSNFIMEGLAEEHRAIRFHVQCFYVWDSERVAPGG